MDALNKIIIENEALYLGARAAYVAAAKAELAAAEAKFKMQQEETMKLEKDLTAEAMKGQKMAEMRLDEAVRQLA